MESLRCVFVVSTCVNSKSGVTCCWLWKGIAMWNQYYFWDMDCMIRVMHLTSRRVVVCAKWLSLNDK